MPNAPHPAALAAARLIRRRFARSLRRLSRRALRLMALEASRTPGA